MTISIPVAELIGTFLETFAYGLSFFECVSVSLLDTDSVRYPGVYLVIFPKCLAILRKKDAKRGLMPYLLATMWIGFVLTTVVRVSNDRQK